MKFLRNLSVFALCALVSLVILDLVLFLFIPSSSGEISLGFLNFFFLPFIIVGGIVFGSILFLLSDHRQRSSAPWLIIRGALCGALYAAFVMLAFLAIVPLALVYIVGGGLAGAASGYLWCRLVEQQDV